MISLREISKEKCHWKINVGAYNPPNPNRSMTAAFCLLGNWSLDSSRIGSRITIRSVAMLRPAWENQVAV
jgi:hypothetical protein